MELPESALLFIDDALVVVDKPAGLPVHATRDPGRDHLQAAVARLMVRRGLDAAHVGLPHRLDVGTSGLVVLGRTPTVTAQLGALFAARETQKTYLALTARPRDLPPSPLDVRNHLAPNRQRGGWPMVAVRAGGDAAWTTLHLVSLGPQALLWQADLHTGRRHQIRVHLAGVGAPLAGDTEYGSPLPAPRPMLHAWRLTLPHPVTHSPLSCEAPLPADFRALATRLRLAMPPL